MAVVLAFAVFGCSSIAETFIDKPKIALASIALQDVTLIGATVQIGVEVDNPNSFSLRIHSIQYNLELGGRAISKGKIESLAEVAAKSKTVVMVPVPVKFADLFASVSEFFAKNTSRYRLQGEAKVGLLTLPFDETGELKLR